MVRLGGFFVAALITSACTSYVDAILPTPDGGMQTDVVSEKRLVELDSIFGQAGVVFVAAASGNRAVDAVIGPDGTIYVLLQNDCTLVALTERGAPRRNFGEEGVMQGDLGCEGRKLHLDSLSKRLLVVGASNPIFMIFAHNLDGTPSMTLPDGDRMKVDLGSFGSLLTTRQGLLVAGTASFAADITVEAIGGRGSLNRQTLVAAERSTGLLLYQTLSDDIFLFAAAPGKGGTPPFGFLTAPVTALAELGPANVIDPLETTASAFETFTAAASGRDGQPLVLGEGWQKGSAMERRPIVWAPDDKTFGKAGAAVLPQRSLTIYSDLAYFAGRIAFVGTGGKEGERRPVLTALDSHGNMDPHFAMPNFFELPLADDSVATKVLFASQDSIVVIGNRGAEGNAGVFVSRVKLK